MVANCLNLKYLLFILNMQEKNDLFIWKNIRNFAPVEVPHVLLKNEFKVKLWRTITT